MEMNRQQAPGTRWTGAWVDPRPTPDALDHKKIHTYEVYDVYFCKH